MPANLCSLIMPLHKILTIFWLLLLLVFTVICSYDKIYAKIGIAIKSKKTSS